MKRQISSRRLALVSALAALFITSGSVSAQTLEDGIGVIAPVPFALSTQVYRPGDSIPLQISTVFNDIFDSAGNGIMQPIVIVAQIWATENIDLGNWRPTELTVGRSWTVPENRFPKETMIYTLSFTGPALTWNCPKPVSKDTCGTAEGTVGNVDIAISGEVLPRTSSRAASLTAPARSSTVAPAASSTVAATSAPAPRPTTTSVPNFIPSAGFKAGPSVLALAMLLLALVFF